MPASRNLRDVITGDNGRPLAAVTTLNKRGSDDTNYGTADVRGRLDTRVITLHSLGAADEFKIRVTDNTGKRTDTDTIAFTDGTDAAATDLQTALITATGDAGLTVTGTTDAGPYTVTFSTSPHRNGIELRLVGLAGCSGTVTSGPVTYRNRGTNTETTAAADATAAPGYGDSIDVPLGTSIVTNGTGQTAGAEYVPPAITSAIGGALQVVVGGSVHASDGTDGLVGFTVYKTSDDSWAGAQTVTEDADMTVTITGLTAATDYYIVAAAQTESTTSGSRVSPPASRVYFTTT